MIPDQKMVFRQRMARGSFRSDGRDVGSDALVVDWPTASASK